MRRTLVLVLVASVALAACEGARNNSSWTDRKEGTEVVPELQKPETEAAASDSVAVDTTQVTH